jgi:hypothetical protein
MAALYVATSSVSVVPLSALCNCVWLLGSGFLEQWHGREDCQ